MEQGKKDVKKDEMKDNLKIMRSEPLRKILYELKPDAAVSEPCPPPPPPTQYQNAGEDIISKSLCYT
jgi:hypothetical protein